MTKYFSAFTLSTAGNNTTLVILCIHFRANLKFPTLRSSSKFIYSFLLESIGTSLLLALLKAQMASAPDEEDADLDDELEALFDDDEPNPNRPNEQNGPGDQDAPAPVTPQPDQPPPHNRELCIPASPEREPPKPRPRTILDALVAKRESSRLNANAAAIAADAAALVAESTNAQNETALLKGCLSANTRADPRQHPLSTALSKKRKIQPSQPIVPPKEQARRTRDAFRVLGSAQQKQQRASLEVTERNVTNMALQYACLDAPRLTALFEHSTRVDISQLTARFEDIRAARLSEWVLFGCLVAKHSKKEAKSGGKYAVWSLCNMPRWTVDDQVPASTNVTLLLFEDAFEAFHTLAEGSVIALRKPKLLPPRESEQGRPSERGGVEWSGLCARVSNRQQVVMIGVCKDYSRCAMPDGDAGECGRWFDRNRMVMCVMHLQRKRRKLVTGSRMDINNAERAAGSGEARRNAVDGSTDISRRGDTGGGGVATELRPEEEDRRRRKTEEVAKASVLRRKRDAMLGKSLKRTHVMSAGAGRSMLKAAGQSRGMMMLKMSKEEPVANGIGRKSTRKAGGAMAAAGGKQALSNGGRQAGALKRLENFGKANANRSGSASGSHHAAVAGRDADIGGDVANGSKAVAGSEGRGRAGNQERVVSQSDYDKAVAILMQVGFSLTWSGNLIAPSSSGLIRLRKEKRGRDRIGEEISVGDGTIETKKDDDGELYLSDESL